jgi:hypothetical protein
MNIAQKELDCNSQERCGGELGLAGNIVPHIWYKLLLRPSGRSDNTAITILSELWFLHRLNGDSEFQLNYHYFKEKFNFGFNQVKDAVVRLEKSDLVVRRWQTVIFHGRKFTQELFLSLRVANVFKLTASAPLKKFALADGKESSHSEGISSAKAGKKD